MAFVFIVQNVLVPISSERTQPLILAEKKALNHPSADINMLRKRVNPIFYLPKQPLRSFCCKLYKAPAAFEK